MIGKRIIPLLLVQFTVILVHSQNTLLDSTIHEDELKKIVNYLAADSLMGRLTGSSQADDAARFIANEFEKSGLSPMGGNNEYFMRMFNSLGNVLGGLPGKSLREELVIFCAHYDHAGTTSSSIIKKKSDKSDTIYNGADDNASGVGALISLARYFGRLRNNERTILFIAFTGEESGLHGSKRFVPILRHDRVITVINFDMIGRPTGNLRPFLTGDWKSNLLRILNKELNSVDPDKYGKNYFATDNFSNENLFSRSDNYPFAQKGIPAHTIMFSNPDNPHYHAVTDEAESLNYKKMETCIRAIALATRGIIRGKQTPSRIEK